MMELDYERDCRIDHSALDIEWLKQPDLAMRYCKQYAEAIVDYNNACEHKKTIRSDLIKEANEDPEECIGKAKPNAADIEAYYRSHEDYKEARKQEIDAEYEMRMAEFAKNEICFTRKNSLENLVKLLGLQYFATPDSPRDLMKEMSYTERQEKKQENIQKKMKMKRRKTNGKSKK